MAVCNSDLVDIQTDLTDIFLDKKLEDFYRNFYSNEKHKSKFHLKEAKHYSDPSKNIQYVSLEHSSCIECGHPVKALDDFHGEVVCEGCGLITPYFKYESHDFSEEFENENFKSLSMQGKRVNGLLKKYQNTKKQRYNDSHNALLVDIIAGYYMMTAYQRQDSKDVIDNFSLKRIHSRLNERAIVLGVCIYFQKKDKRHIKIKDSKYCESFGLNTHGYRVISNNLNRLLEF